MNGLGEKIAAKRKDAGLTQEQFAEKLSVTRQSVGRWETGAAMPDIDKIPDIARILNTSCDYLLKDEAEEERREAPAARGISRLLAGAKGRKVRLNFFDEEADIELYNCDCTVLDFEGNWMKVEAETKKGRIEKLIPVSSVLSLAFVKEGE